MRTTNDPIAQVVLVWGLCAYAVALPLMQNPYSPLIGTTLGSGKIQLTDLILLFVAPFGAIALFRDKGRTLRSYYGLLLVAAVYLVILVANVRVYTDPGGYFQVVAAVSLVVLFVLVLQAGNSAYNLKLLLASTVCGVALAIGLSLFGLVAYAISGWKWSYVLQENHVFPYFGDVVRLTGPLQPTAKLFSSYLTLAVPSLIAGAAIVCSRRSRIILLLLAGTGIVLYPMTISRGVVGFAFAVSFVLYYLWRDQTWLRWLPRTGFAITLILFVVTLFASTIYIVDKEVAYHYDGRTSYPHTVYYYYDPVRGKENVDLRIEFARDHYFWLKKAAVEIIERYPWGVGNGRYSDFVAELEDQKIVPDGLSRHPTPQAQFFYAGAERGWIGVIGVGGLFVSWIIGLGLRRDNIVVTAALGSLLALCFIDSLYLEITRFRFLWFFSALFLALGQQIQRTSTQGNAACG